MLEIIKGIPYILDPDVLDENYIGWYWCSYNNGRGYIYRFLVGDIREGVELNICILINNV